MKKINKHLSFIILVGILACLTVGCSTNEKGDSKGNVITKIDTTSIVESKEDSETKMLPDLPEDVNYNNHEFTFLISGNTENNWKKNDFFAEEENGEPINDARYSRNSTIEEKYGVKIKTIENYDGSAGYKLFQKSVAAGDYTYDAGMISGYDACSLASSGYLYDLNQLPYLDLSKPWWDQKANEDLTIKGRIYYTTGDISTADNDCTYSILFNKKLVNEYDLPNPYELVKNGKWTIDEFSKMAKAVSADLNGDSKRDKNDLYGSIIWDDTMMGIVNSIDEKCATINSDGEIELTLYNDRVVQMFEKFTDIVYDKNVSYAYQRISHDIDDPVSMFSNDQSLFYLQLLDLVTYFRNMETDFGILPYPKLDENQEEYRHTIGSWHSVFLCVPLVVENPERTGVILEALAAESMYTLTPAYYEKTLVSKFVRDTESSDMLDIILSTRVYDLGWYYQIGGYNEEIMNLFRNYKKDFSSMYTKFESKANGNIKKINEAFSNTFEQEDK